MQDAGCMVRSLDSVESVFNCGVVAIAPRYRPLEKGGGFLEPRQVFSKTLPQPATRFQHPVSSIQQPIVKSTCPPRPETDR